MTKSEIEKLIEVAGKATPGPWRTNLALDLHRLVMAGDKHRAEIIADCKTRIAPYTKAKDEGQVHNTVFIAAFNPETALRLCRLALAGLEAEEILVQAKLALARVPMNSDANLEAGENLVWDAVDAIRRAKGEV